MEIANKNNIIDGLGISKDVCKALSGLIKKKNIRPLNGFRPASPPLKDAFTQQNSSSNQNFNNMFNNNNNNENNNDNKLSMKNSKNKIESHVIFI